MSGRGWGGSTATAVAVAGGAGAAQLGLGYGLGVIAWKSSGDAAGDGAWLGSLAWTIWIAASATVLGALVADRTSAGDRGLPPSRQVLGNAGVYGTAPATTPTILLWRLTLPLAAAFGALVTLPLVAVPAREIHRVETASPDITAGGYALVGVILGLVVAVGVLACRAAATNVLVTGSWLWALAVAAVVDVVAQHRSVTLSPLAIWRFTSHGWSIHGSLYVWDVLLMLGAAVLIGAAAGWRGARRDDNRVGVALSGAAGPLLVAVAYFLAAPPITPSYFLETPRVLATVPNPQLSAYLIAPYAIIAGLAGSALATLFIGRTGPAGEGVPLPPAGSGPASTVAGKPSTRTVASPPAARTGPTDATAADPTNSTAADTSTSRWRRLRGRSGAAAGSIAGGESTTGTGPVDGGGTRPAAGTTAAATPDPPQNAKNDTSDAADPLSGAAAVESTDDAGPNRKGNGRPRTVPRPRPKNKS